MKLVIQVPCYNEAESLPHAIPQLPRHIAGCDTIEWLVIDDGQPTTRAVLPRNSASIASCVIRLTGGSPLRS